MDDEIKLASLEALVLEELEQLLILNPNRLRTFEDARLEIVTYVEAKFDFKICDSKPSGTGSRGHSDPTDVDAVNSLSRLAVDKNHRVRVMGVLCAVDHFFTETAMHARAQAIWIFSLKKHPTKKFMAMPGNQTIGLPITGLLTLNLASHPTHVVLDIGCTWSIGSKAAIERFKKHA